MIHAGNAITVQMLSDGIAEFRFDLQGESVNKFNRATIEDFKAAIEAVKANNEVKGLIVTSAKSTFIVGADITEFGANFAQGEQAIVDWALPVHDIFNAFEDLDIPKVAAINGMALGGGFEMCLVCDYRVMSDQAQVGLPEIKLGIFPGFGGTVRLSRVIGIDNAVEWMAMANPKRPDAALKDGAVDAVVAADKLQDAALDLVKQAIAGRLDWKAKRQEKLDPVKLNPLEQMMAFNTAKGAVLAKANPAQYPAPKLMLDSLQAGASLPRNEALQAEAAGFAKAAVTPQAGALIGLFINDQVVKKTSKKYEKGAHPVNQAAVLGAGIMGGGIAYQAASKGTPIIMKDIGNPQLALGMKEANGLLTKQVERKKLTPAKMGETLARIRPTLSYDEFKEVDIVIEAVTENPKVKGIVLAETEKNVRDNTIIASNTSTISITRLAENLQRPENFVGMHFFNPVPKMPLVEVIRGKDTSEETVAAVVAYAAKMGKSPIVVNDCPGFFVNRVLFPYFAGFSKLVLDGADFAQVDKVMEKQFGWPMGPAYLLDVVGLDTAYHCTDVMAAGFPTRMAKLDNDPVAAMYQANRYGQKNGLGFYAYSKDAKGKPKKDIDAESLNLLSGIAAAKQDFNAEDIIARLMVPMINETIRCLEEGIVASAAEADMGLVYGLGFPPFRGGPLRYVDTLGLANFVALADKYAHLGEIYQVTEQTRAMAANGQRFFPV